MKIFSCTHGSRLESNIGVAVAALIEMVMMVSITISIKFLVEMVMIVSTIIISIKYPAHPVSHCLR